MNNANKIDDFKRLPEILGDAFHRPGEERPTNQEKPTQEPDNVVVLLKLIRSIDDKLNHVADKLVHVSEMVSYGREEHEKTQAILHDLGTYITTPTSFPGDEQRKPSRTRDDIRTTRSAVILDLMSDGHPHHYISLHERMAGIDDQDVVYTQPTSLCNFLNDMADRGMILRVQSGLFKCKLQEGQNVSATSQ